MSRRRYSQFFDQKPSLAMTLHEQEEIDKKFEKLEQKIHTRVKKEVFFGCEECVCYDPTPDGKFGCNRTGTCKNSKRQIKKEKINVKSTK